MYLIFFSCQGPLALNYRPCKSLSLSGDAQSPRGNADAQPEWTIDNNGFYTWLRPPYLTKMTILQIHNSFHQHNLANHAKQYSIY